MQTLCLDIFTDPHEEIPEVATPVNPATELLKQGAGKQTLTVCVVAYLINIHQDNTSVFFSTFPPIHIHAAITVRLLK